MWHRLGRWLGNVLMCCLPIFDSGMELQFEWDQVAAFVTQPDGSLFSWRERFTCFRYLIYGIVSSTAFLPCSCGSYLQQFTCYIWMHSRILLIVWADCFGTSATLNYQGISDINFLTTKFPLFIASPILLMIVWTVT
jgi:hypothetical protein